MDTSQLTVGSRIDHPAHGAGTVTFVGTDYLGIAFDAGGEALIRRDTLKRGDASLPRPVEPSRESLPWPESTFVPVADSAQHFMGSHWEPLVDNVSELLGRLPEIVPQAMTQSGWGAIRSRHKPVPAGWPQGFQLVWPLRTHGLALILRPGPDANDLVSLFPFFHGGGQHTLRLHEVLVWQGGLEAQITAGWGEGEVTFFDAQYLVNRAWYEAGKDYEFILSGIAYDARPAKKREWQVTRNPDEVAWMNQKLAPGEEPHEATVTVSMVGAAMFMPIAEWDADDYSFHGPIKKVEPFQDWLGQDGWKVRATVMRFGDVDADLHIVITRRAWSGEEAPQAGQDIEGRLWLQGYLWSPTIASPKPIASVKNHPQRGRV